MLYKKVQLEGGATVTMSSDCPKPFFLILLLLLFSFIFISYVGAQVDKGPSLKSDKSVSKSYEKPIQLESDLQLLLTAISTTAAMYVIAILILRRGKGGNDGP